MRNLLKTLFVVAIAAPVLASAAITGSKHDLSSGSGNTVRATSETQICKFCHAAHQASTQVLLWNHAAGTVNGFPTGAATLGGTQLQAALNAASPSRACLACHDGTVALGALTQQGNITIAGLTGQIGTAARVNLGGDHPINVPMPVPAGGATYNGTTQGATVNSADFKTAAAAQTNGVRLFATIGAAGAAANGVECGSCHDVHNGVPAANGFFLRVPQAGSQICLACHTK
jgi:predicted CXXCH cytochrome family protein